MSPARYHTFCVQGVERPCEYDDYTKEIERGNRVFNRYFFLTIFLLLIGCAYGIWWLT